MNSLFLLYIKKIFTQKTSYILMLITFISLWLITLLSFNAAVNFTRIRFESDEAASYGKIINTSNAVAANRLDSTNYNKRRLIYRSSDKLSYNDLSFNLYYYDLEGFYLPNELKSIKSSNISDGLILDYYYAELLATYLEIDIEDIKDIDFDYNGSKIRVSEIIHSNLDISISSLANYGFLLYNDGNTDPVNYSYDYLNIDEAEKVYEDLTGENGEFTSMDITTNVSTIADNNNAYMAFIIITFTILFITMLIMLKQFYNSFDILHNRNKDLYKILKLYGFPDKNVKKYDYLEFLAILVITFVISTILYLLFDFILGRSCDFNFIITTKVSNSNFFSSSWLYYPLLFVFELGIFTLYFMLKRRVKNVK